MDLGTAIIGAIFIALFILPFVLMNRNRKQRAQVILMKLKEFAAQHNCSIDQSDIFGNVGIGIDVNKLLVFHCSRVEEQFKFHFLDLHEIQSCKVINQHHKSGSKGHEVTITNRLDLGFAHQDDNQTVTKWNFYASEEGLQLTNELSLVENWNTLINSRLVQSA